MCRGVSGAAGAASSAISCGPRSAGKFRRLAIVLAARQRHNDSAAPRRCTAATASRQPVARSRGTTASRSAALTGRNSRWRARGSSRGGRGGLTAARAPRTLTPCPITFVRLHWRLDLAGSTVAMSWLPARRSPAALRLQTDTASSSCTVLRELQDRAWPAALRAASPSPRRQRYRHQSDPCREDRLRGQSAVSELPTQHNASVKAATPTMELPRDAAARS